MPVPVPSKSSTNVGDEQINQNDTVNVSNDSNPRQNYTQSRLPQHWKVNMSDTGTLYYYNEITGEERETRPN